MIFFFNDTATTEIYTLSLHDALPILAQAAESTPRLAHASHHSAPREGRAGSRWLADIPRSWRGNRNQRSDSASSQPLKDRKSTRLNSSHANISYAVFCLKKKNNKYH